MHAGQKQKKHGHRRQNGLEEDQIHALEKPEEVSLPCSPFGMVRWSDLEGTAQGRRSRGEIPN